MSEGKKYRLVTRSDFDGLVCAVLLRHLDLIDEIKFVHPKDMQDGVIEIGPNDITTNLPYVEGVYLAFDHHLSETLRVGQRDNHIILSEAPSAARVVHDHFGGAERFPAAWAEMMAAVDQADSARYSLGDIIDPDGWTLLNYVMDARTGLGRFRDFRISNYQLMMNLIEYCRNHTIDDILSLEDVKERTDIYFEHQEKFKDQIHRCARVYTNLVVLDLRGEEVIYAGNRFMIYALYPETNVSIHALWGVKKQNTVFAIGKSILNRSSRTNIGELCLRHGGGGHANAGTCQVDNDTAERVLAGLIARITADG
jgi:nanoRNase/pAp phosphatase (c-di-AMP/oligoRNAs hydrolase)